MSGRDIMEAALRRELVGPQAAEAPRGKPLDVSAGLVTFESWEQVRGPWHDAASGEEILSDIDPLRRYGVGVLHPRGVAVEDSLAGVTGIPADDEVADSVEAPQLQIQKAPDSDDDDFDLSDANSFQPSAMAVSFKVRLAATSVISVEAQAATYQSLPVKVKGAKRERRWWARRPFTIRAAVTGDQLLKGTEKLLALEADRTGETSATPQLQAYSRPVPGEPDPDTRLVTIALVNATQAVGSSGALFQAAFEVRAGAGARIDPYPEPAPPGGAGDEDESIALLYRNKVTYAVGHGCAADWDEPADGATGAVRAEPLPAFEVPSLTPDIVWTDKAGKRQELHIEKQGSTNLRWAVCQAAWQLVRHSQRWRAVYLKLKARMKAQKAITAIARRLLCLMTAILKSGQPYQLARPVA